MPKDKVKKEKGSKKGKSTEQASPVQPEPTQKQSTLLNNPSVLAAQMLQVAEELKGKGQSPEYALAEAQVHATLYVGDQLGTLLDYLERGK